MKSILFCLTLLAAFNSNAYKFTAEIEGKTWTFNSESNQSDNTYYRVHADCISGLYVLTSAEGGIVQMRTPREDQPIKCEIIYRKVPR